MKILQPPALELDKILYKDRSMSAHVRLERRIVWNLFDHLKKAGFEPVTVLSDDTVKTKNAKEAMEEIFNLDDCHVEVKKPDGKKHWFRLVCGNGEDIISDWGIPKISDGFDEAMQSFDSDLYL